MTTLNAINKAVKENIPLNIAEENLKYESEQKQEQQQKQTEFKSCLNKLGVVLL